MHFQQVPQPHPKVSDPNQRFQCRVYALSEGWSHLVASKNTGWGLSHRLKDSSFYPHIPKWPCYPIYQSPHMYATAAAAYWCPWAQTDLEVDNYSQYSLLKLLVGFKSAVKRFVHMLEVIQRWQFACLQPLASSNKLYSTVELLGVVRWSICRSMTPGN